MNQERYFKIKYGYSMEDQVSIPEKEVQKAIYAQITGKPVQLGSSFIKGSNIISISPHYHKHTGWHDWYEPKGGDDWKQIERDCPNYDGVLEWHKNKVSGYITSGELKKISEGETMKQIEAHITEKQNITKELSDKFKIQ
jgi:hypothetical protein